MDQYLLIPFVRGMNIHLPAILMFTRATRFWHTAVYEIENSPRTGMMIHRCPFPIGWLMKKEGFEETPLTTGFYDDRWYTSHRPKPSFTKRTLLGWCFIISLRKTQSLKHPETLEVHLWCTLWNKFDGLSWIIISFHNCVWNWPTTSIHVRRYLMLAIARD